MNDLHARIMNLPCNPPDTLNGSQAYDYKCGHRDARHAAAELAAAADARIAELEKALAGMLKQFGMFGRQNPYDMSQDAFAVERAREALKEPK